MRQKTITLYQYSELPTERAKERARDWCREGIAGDSFFAECPTEEFAELLKVCGFRVNARRGTRSEPAIYWNLNPIEAGFDAAWSAHDLNAAKCGALLKDRPAEWLDQHGARQRSKANAETHRIVRAFMALALDYPEAAGTVSSGRDGCTVRTEFDTYGHPEDGMSEAQWKGAADTFQSLCADAADAFASAINAEYEYQNSDEAVIESIEANQYEFTEEGDRA